MVYLSHLIILTFRLYFRLCYIAVYCIPLPVKVYLSHLILLTFRLYFRLHYIAVYCIPLPVKVNLSHLILLTFRLYFKLHYIAVYCIPLPVKVYLLHLVLLTFRWGLPFTPGVTHLSVVFQATLYSSIFYTFTSKGWPFTPDVTHLSVVLQGHAEERQGRGSGDAISPEQAVLPLGVSIVYRKERKTKVWTIYLGF